MRQDHYTTFPPAVKLPTLGQMLTAITPTQRVTVFADVYKEPIVSGKLAKDVSWQDVGRYADCLVRAFEACEDGSIAIGIVFGGVR